jgi:hypothetical protein
MLYEFLFKQQVRPLSFGFKISIFYLNQELFFALEAAYLKLLEIDYNLNIIYYFLIFFMLIIKN